MGSVYEVGLFHYAVVVAAVDNSVSRCYEFANVVGIVWVLCLSSSLGKGLICFNIYINI